MKKRWTEDEINILISNIESLGFSDGITATAKEIGRSRNGVYEKVVKLGYKSNYGYTKDEAQYFEILLSENPGNIKKAIRLFAEKVGKTPDTITQAYYKCKTSPIYRGNLNACFVTLSKYSQKNSKIFTTDNSIATPTIWDKVIKMFKQLKLW